MMMIDDARLAVPTVPWDRGLKTNTRTMNFFQMSFLPCLTMSVGDMRPVTILQIVQQAFMVERTRA